MPGSSALRREVMWLASFFSICIVGCGQRSPPAKIAPNSPPTKALSNTPSAKAMPSTIAEWVLDETDAKSLGSSVQISGFEIRPPASFRYVKYEKQPSHIWAGPIRSDETYALLMVLVLDLSDQESKLSLDQQFEKVTGAFKSQHKNWSMEKVEHGTINGIHFVRTSWSGMATSAARKGLAGREMHGIAYLSTDGKRSIQIMCQDVAPNHAESLRVGQLAALSIRRARAEDREPR